jgi:hypothetical protein
MAKQQGPNYFVGKLGNLIGYRIGDQYFVRSMPEKVHQSKATQKASQDFGIASKAGKLVRHAIQNRLDIPSDGTVTNRLNTTLTPVIKLDNFSALLEGFSFNKHTPLEKIMKQAPKLVKNADGTFQLQIPAQTLSRSRAATHMEIKVLGASINFAKHKHTALDESTLFIDLKKPFTGATFTLPAQGNGTTLYVLQVRAVELVNRKYYDLEDRRYYAAEIIAVIPERILKPARKNKMQDLKKLLPDTHTTITPSARVLKRKAKKAPPGR